MRAACTWTAQRFDAARARAAHRSAHPVRHGRASLAAAEKIDKAAFTRADLVEIVGAQLPVDTERTPRELVETAVDEVAVRLTAPRAAHQREGHERFTLDAILDEEAAVLDLVDARNDRAMLWINDEDTAHLSADQKRAVREHRPLTVADPAAVRAGRRGQNHLDARAARRRAPPLRRDGAGARPDRQGRRRRGPRRCRRPRLHDRQSPAPAARQPVRARPAHPSVVDEAAMVGTRDLRQLLTATTAAGAKTVLVGDEHQLAPVKARGGMFAQLCTDLPWTQHLSAGVADARPRRTRRLPGAARRARQPAA